MEYFVRAQVGEFPSLQERIRAERNQNRATDKKPKTFLSPQNENAFERLRLDADECQQTFKAYQKELAALGDNAQVKADAQGGRQAIKAKGAKKPFGLKK
jgi:hypothetical protein